MSHLNRRKAGYLQINGRNSYIYEGANIIGRNKEATVVLRDPLASQYHALIVVIYEVQDFPLQFIADLNSTNGTFIDERKLVPYIMYPIRDGMKIEFTSSFKGPYRKVYNSSQESNFSQNTNESQMTQLEDGFYGASTQIVDSYEQLLNDGEDENLSNLEINTQVINRSINNRVISIHVMPTQPVHASINEVATQIMHADAPCEAKNSGLNAPVRRTQEEKNNSIHELPTQATTDHSTINTKIIKTRSLPSIHDVATQITGDNSTINTKINKTPSLPIIHEVATQITADCTSLNTSEAATSSLTRENSNIHGSETQSVANENESEGISQEIEIEHELIDIHGAATQILVDPDKPVFEVLVLYSENNPNLGEAAVAQSSNETNSALESSTNPSRTITTYNLSTNDGELALPLQDVDKTEELKSIDEVQLDHPADPTTSTQRSSVPDVIFTQSQSPILGGKRNRKNPLDSDSDTDQELRDDNAITQTLTPIKCAKRRTVNPLDSDSESSQEAIRLTVDKDIITQSLTPMPRIKRKVINPLDSDSEDDIEPVNHTDNIQTVDTVEDANDSDTDVDEDIARRAKDAAIANLSTQTVELDTQTSRKSQISLESRDSLNLQLSSRFSQNEVHSDDSIDFLQVASPIIGNHSENLVSPARNSHSKVDKVVSDDILNSDTDEITKSKASDVLNTTNRRKRFSKRISKHECKIIDSDSESGSDRITKGSNTNMPSEGRNSNNTFLTNSSQTDKSIFVITDSEASDLDDKEAEKLSPILMKPPNDTFSDAEEESFVQRKSFADISVDCIPPTQEGNASIQQTNTSVGDGNESFHLELSHIEELTESSTSVQRKSFADTSVDYIPATQDCNASIQQTRTSVSNESESFNLELSHIEELTETSIKDRMSLACDGIVQSTDTKDVRRASSSAKNLVLNATNTNTLDDSCDFISSTQPVTRKRHSNQSDVEVPVTKLREIDNTQMDDCDFEAATQKVNDDFDFAAPTQPVVRRSTKSTSKENCDDDFDFFAPTQLIHGEPSTKNAGSEPVKRESHVANTQSEDFDFDAVTQEITVAEAQPLKENNVDDNDIFLPPTQVISTVNDDKFFDLPPQQVSTEPENLSLFETETQKLDEISFTAPVTTVKVVDKPPEVESQLEVMFLSQNVSLSATDKSRPSNPLANILDASSTQEVVEILTETKKRRSDEFESNEENKKRPKFLSPIKTTCSSSENPPIQSTICESNKKEDQAIATGSGGSTKSLKTNILKQNNNIPKRSKMSLIKRDQKPISDSDDSVSSEFQVYVEVVPIKTKELPKIVEEDTKLSNHSKPPTRSKRRLLDDESMCLLTASSESPKPGQKRQNKLFQNTSSKKQESQELHVEKEPEPDKNEPKKGAKANEPETTKKQETKIKNKAETSKRITRSKQTRSYPAPNETSSDSDGTKVEELPPKSKTVPKSSEKQPEPDKNEPKKRGNANKPKTTKKQETKIKNKAETSKRITRSKQTRSYPAPNQTSSDSDDAKVEELPPKSKTVPKRTNTRAKKNVLYTETIDVIDTDEDAEKITIRVPKRQLKFVTSDNESFADRKDVSTVVRESLQVKTRRPGRPSKKDQVSEELIPSPSADRNKRALKPKIVFTMLNDSQLNSLIRSLGGTIVDNLETSTVLVTKKIQRTLKLLSAIGYAKPICSPDWLYACKRANKFLDPWDHLIQDPEAEDQWNFNIKQSFARRKKQKLFDGYFFQVMVTVSADVIKGSIEANGGKVIARTPSSTDRFIVVAAANQKNKFSTFLKNKITVVTGEAILIGVLRQEIVFDDFLLT